MRFLNKKTILLIISLLLLAVGLLLLAFPSKKPEIKELATLTKPEIATTAIVYQNVEIDVSKNALFQRLPNTLPAFIIKPLAIDHDFKAKQIAASLGITEGYAGFQPPGTTRAPEKATPDPSQLGTTIGALSDKPVQTTSSLRTSKFNNHYIYNWRTEELSLSYVYDTGTFSYSTIATDSGELEPQKAKEGVIDFLARNGILPKDYTTSVALPNVYVIPAIDNIPLITDKNAGNIITLTLNNNYSFSAIDYSFIPWGERVGVYPLKTVEEVVESIKSQKQNPFFIDAPISIFEAGNKPLVSKIVVDKIEINYYLNPLPVNADQNYIQPVYVVTGSYTNGSSVEEKIVFIIPATENKYFKQ